MQNAEPTVDEKLWEGAAAAGWRLKRNSGSHYTYTAPDGKRFHNKREALEAAAQTAPSSGAGAGTESDEDEDSAEAAATVEATAEAATGGQNEMVPFQAAGGDEKD